LTQGEDDVGQERARPPGQGLNEAIGHAKDTQAHFAARFGVSVATLGHWERGDRSPQGPALVLLNLIDRDPAGVLRALS